LSAAYSYGVGTDGIFVLIDDREYGGGSHKLEEVCKSLKGRNIKHMTRRLKVADYIIVKRILPDKELVVPVLIERKRMDDLIDSLKTPRFQRQKDTMLFLMRRFPGIVLKYVIEGNALMYGDQLVNAGMNGAQIEDLAEVNRQEGFDVCRFMNIQDTLNHVADVVDVLSRSDQDELNKMCIGTYDAFNEIIKTWKKQQPKLPKTTKAANIKRATQLPAQNPVSITPKRSAPAAPPPPPVACPICNNILIGSEQDNTVHINNCSKLGGVTLLHEKDDVEERECPTCNSKIKGSSEMFARHVEYCLF